MNRFFCTICNKIKRVRKYPRKRQFDIHPEVLPYRPEDRLGECNFHHNLHRPNIVNRRQAMLAGGR